MAAKPTPSIFVVDDDVTIVEAVTVLLEEENYTVYSSSDGEAALALITTTKPDLVLLDAFLGEKDGRELAQQLKQQASTAHIPILLFSAQNNADHNVEDGVIAAFIPKPFDIEELLATIAAQLKTP